MITRKTPSYDKKMKLLSGSGQHGEEGLDQHEMEMHFDDVNVEKIR